MKIRFLLTVFTPILLSACAVSIEEIQPPTAIPEHFSHTGQLPMQEHWWLVLKDPQLNQLIDSALTNNFSLLAAFNRLQQAQTLADKTSADLIPSISAVFNGDQTYRKSVDNSHFSLGLGASYEVDLWGRIRAQTHAAELDVQSAAENLKTAAITVSTEVAITWYRLIEQRSQWRLLQQQIKTNEDNVQLLISRFAGAQATAADLFQQQQTLEATIGDQSNVLANTKILEHQLAILTGRTPGLLNLPVQNQLPTLPLQPQSGLSTELLQRRPDLRAAYYRVQAADQRIASAIADRYPKLSLSASIDTTAPNLQSLFNNWIGTLAGNVIMPIIDGGRRAAEVERTRAVSAEALNHYATAIQQAIKEVEDALIQEQQQKKLIMSLDKQYQYSQQATLQIRTRYMYGAIDFLRVLSTQISQQALERRRILAKRLLIEYRIQLYRALAGSWSLPNAINTEAPQPKDKQHG